MKRLTAVEGQIVECTPRERTALIRALDRLTKQLRPRLPFYPTQEPGLRITNLVGTIRLDRTTVVDVTPKVKPESDWVGAVVDLLIPGPVAVSGNRAGSARSGFRDLADAVAEIYADRLETALLTHGPLEVLERHDVTSGMLRGRLALSAWTRSSILTPHRFPVSVDTLTPDNDFTAAMCLCAHLLARGTKHPATAQRLRSLATRLRPGAPPLAPVNATVGRRPLPPQWASYKDAWAVVTALLAHSSLLRREGSLSAFDVALESWPLLEELVQRTIDACSALPAAEGLQWSRGPRNKKTLLHPSSGDGQLVEKDGRSVVPDGVLRQEGEILAVFEAKYRRLNGRPAPREHIFQALATAAAHGAAQAVLVYPEKRSPTTFEVKGHNGSPTQLTVMGLDLFSYRRGDTHEASTLFRALRRGASR